MKVLQYPEAMKEMINRIRRPGGIAAITDPLSVFLNPNGLAFWVPK